MDHTTFLIIACIITVIVVAIPAISIKMEINNKWARPDKDKILKLLIDGETNTLVWVEMPTLKIAIVTLGHPQVGTQENTHIPLGCSKMFDTDGAMHTFPGSIPYSTQEIPLDTNEAIDFIEKKYQ